MLEVEEERALSVVVVGASGDLSVRKIYPALFSLYRRGLLPARTRIVGFARSAMDDAAFRERIAAGLKCGSVDARQCSLEQQRFIGRCTYVQGQYGDVSSMQGLGTHLDAEEGGEEANRLFYLAIPPSVFLPTVQALGGAGLVADANVGPWTRVVVEKPFGFDRESSDVLTAGIAAVFDESQTFRIDHYLGKDVVQNLMVLRFANTIFEPIWSRKTISHVHVVWKENLDLKGRAGYFDSVGIIRDVVQNHLTQIVALLAMERPEGIDSHSIRNAKVDVLRRIRPLTEDDVVCGQYTAGMVRGRAVEGYLEDDAVPADSCTATYAAAVLTVDGDRWRGVPFLVSAGKGLDASKTEIQIHFKSPEPAIYGEHAVDEPNDLVIRVQPEPSITLKVCNKVPGMGLSLDTQELDLSYWHAYGNATPEAYESLLLDVVRGERSLFIRGDELEAAWDIYTPLLHKLDERRVKPIPYAFGATGPEAVDALALRNGIRDARHED